MSYKLVALGNGIKEADGEVDCVTLRGKKTRNKESESEWALLDKYVNTYKEFDSVFFPLLTMYRHKHEHKLKHIT